MTDARRYLRWSAPNSQVSAALREAMREEQRTAPSPDQLAAMTAKVQQALGVADPAPDQGGGDRPLRSISLRLSAVLGAAVLAGVGPMLVQLAHRERAPSHAAAETRSAQASPSISSADPVHAGLPPATEPSATSDPTVAATSRTPAPRSRRRGMTSKIDATLPADSPRVEQRSAALPQPPRDQPPRDHGDELPLLLRARRAVVPAPTEALALLEQHAREFPTGAFVEEREALTIEALASASAREQASLRAHRFFAAFPHSAYRRRIEALLAEP